MYSKTLMMYLGAFFTAFLAVSMVLFPENAFNAALEGLHLWWNVVFPALLPFFYGCRTINWSRSSSFYGSFARTFNETYI